MAKYSRLNCCPLMVISVMLVGALVKVAPPRQNKGKLKWQIWESEIAVSTQNPSSRWRQWRLLHFFRSARWRQGRQMLVYEFMPNGTLRDHLSAIVSSQGRQSIPVPATMDIDSQPTMEETIIVGDDLMLGPPSPVIPPEIASHVLEGVDLCDGILRNFFLCLQINDIEPFCQDEIVLYQECVTKRDKELRQRLFDSEHKLGLSMPLDEAKERADQLQSDVTSLERHMILASGVEGMEGFRQRWSLHGRIQDTKGRLEALNQGIEKRKHDKIQEESKGANVKKKWFFW
ncbi:hypothetical protein Cni_G29381 [Canna indica]|uniref:DUF7803 domain-containing protein n=1 Tax=Canna indica TaxID=4628 RepID=A0AAQ3L928_9LILI|nr:hypothetical protein Cni_G29381 [Canna indica]